MKDTGRKITTSEKVRRHHRETNIGRASLAARMAVIRFSSTKRKIFSSTTIASSITTPDHQNEAPAW
jgi:hypothetical protein